MSVKRSLAAGIIGVCLLVTALFSATGSSASGSIQRSAVKTVTFNKDVAPIFYQKCADCHHPGEAAPFSVLTYKDSRPWAKSIREKVANREMPPWHADPHFGQFSNDRRLSQQQIDTIVAWADAGAPEGSPKDLPPAPKFTEGWSIGKPDVILEVAEEYTIEASGPDEYQYFDVATNFTEDRYVQAAEARPSNRKVVHHIIAFIVPPGAPNTAKMTKEQRDKAMEMQLRNSPFYRDGFLMRIKDDQPVVDDSCAPENARRGGGQNENILTGYAPGHNPDIWEPGIGKRIPAGSTIRFQIHYSKIAGTVQKDRSAVGLIFSKEPPKKLVATRSVGNMLFKIPPGAENHKVTGCLTLRDDTRIYALMPHMHLRGKSMEYKAVYPDGKSEVLINVPAYSFAWQTNYLLKEPKLLPKGTRIMVTAYFDNSTKNKYNPDPTKAVRYGEPTYDEMMLGFMDYGVERPPLAKVDSKVLDSYVGRYEVGPGIAMTVTSVSGKLFGQVATQPKVELLPESETTFYIREMDSVVTFVRADGGAVSEAILDMGGRTMRGKRVKDVATGSVSN
ncbi:MAG: DUF3471 domain-containing protein [Acidobacteriota bacterium]